MGIPRVLPSRLDNQTGVVRPGPTGIIAILACAAAGPLNTATSWLDDSLMQKTFLAGPGVDDVSYALNGTGNPVVYVRTNATTPGAYGTVYQLRNGGTSIASAGASTPLIEANILIDWVAAGTIGVTGIQYTVSLDGGNVTSAPIALGTASIIEVLYPNSTQTTGIEINLAAGTVAIGGQVQMFTTRPQPNNADIVTALEALRVTKLPWECLYVDVDATTTMVTTIDTWLTALNKRGIFNEGFLNLRHKLLPILWNSAEAGFASSSPSAPAETENTYGSAFAAWSTVSSDQVIVGADAAFEPSLLTGVTVVVQAALVIAVRAMSIPLGQDPAWVATGPVSATIFDASGNPYWHDENLYELLDSQRFSTLRTVDGEDGTYITNANVFSSPGSDYTFLPYLRVINAAATVAYQLLTKSLSQTIGKQQPDPVTGAIYPLEEDCQLIEQNINPQIVSKLAGSVQAAQIVLSRTDDISSNAGSVIDVGLQVEVLALIKGFRMVMSFVKNISVPTA